jgi:hypothetical protein
MPFPNPIVDPPKSVSSNPLTISDGVYSNQVCGGGDTIFYISTYWSGSIQLRLMSRNANIYVSACTNGNSYLVGCNNANNHGGWVSGGTCYSDATFCYSVLPGTSDESTIYLHCPNVVYNCNFNIDIYGYDTGGTTYTLYWSQP